MPLSLIARRLVLLSALAAVATGCWLLAPLGLPSVAAGVAFAAAAAAARAQFRWTAIVVLCLAYTAYGTQRLIAGPAMAAVPLWLATFAGLAVGGASWQRWEAPRRWRLPLAWWGLSVALSWPLIVLRELDFAATGPRGVAGLVVTTALLHLSLVLWMDTLLAASRRDATLHPHGPAPLVRPLAFALLASAVVTALAAIQQRAFDMAWLSGEPWVSLGRTVGMMGDANPMGTATAVWAPLAVAMLGTFGWTVGAILWAAAWLSGSRTTLVLIVAGLVGLSLRSWSHRRPSARALALAALVVVAVVGALSWLLPSAGPSTPLGRLRDTIPATSVGAAAYEVLWNRDGYGRAANRAIAEHPTTGVGIGVFGTLSSSYLQRAGGPPVPPDNAQSLWRQTLAERGMLGLLPLLWLTLLTAGLVFGRRRTRSTTQTAIERRHVAEQTVLRAVIVGLGLALMVGFPVQDPAIAVTLATLVALLAATVAPPMAASTAAAAPTSRPGQLGWAVILLLACLGAGIDYASATTLGLPARAARGNAQYVKGFGAQEAAPDGTMARAVRGAATMVLPVAGRQFVLRGWVRSPAGASHLQVWHESALIVDESFADGATFERTLTLVPGGPGFQVRLDVSQGDVLVAGRFEKP